MTSPTLSALFALAQLSFAQIALISSLLIAITCGLLSPMIVLKQRSYLGDSLAHLVFPGVVGGYFLSVALPLPLWLAIFAGAGITGYLGNVCTESLRKNLGVPHDAAAVITLTGFFSIGVTAVSKQRGTRIDLDKLLFGDILTMNWNDVAVMAGVLLVVALCLFYLKQHWEAWILDSEFAKIIGFRVQFVERLFVLLTTVAVLSGMFSVGGLMMSALLTLPSVLFKPRSIISAKAILCSVCTALIGITLAFSLDWPVGSSIVLVGFVLVLLKLGTSYRRFV